MELEHVMFLAHLCFGLKGSISPINHLIPKSLEEAHSFLKERGIYILKVTRVKEYIKSFDFTVLRL